MTRTRALVIGLSALLVTAAGGVGASALMDLPQDAVPVQDTTADLNRQSAEQVRAANEALAPREQAPEGAPAPAAPVPITPPTIAIQTGSLDEEPEDEDEAETLQATPLAPTAAPDRRQRMRVAVVEAVDKVTANRMRFEVPVGGRPVRFNKQLIFAARACDVSAADEPVKDSIAYLEVSVQPRGLLNAAASPREVFQGWMFASSPAVSGLQHPTYDAWIVGCKA